MNGKRLGSIALTVSLVACTTAAHRQPSSSNDGVAASPPGGENAIASPGPVPGDARALGPHTRPFVTRAEDLGLADPKKMLKIRLWLKPPATAALSETASDLMNRGSARYHHWLSGTQALRQFKAPPSSAQKVQRYLENKGGRGVKADPNGTYVTARFSVKRAQSLFKVELHDFLLDGKAVIANLSDPRLDDEIAVLVAYVGGLTTHQKTPFFTRQRDLDTGKFIEAKPFAANAQTGAHETQCFSGVETKEFVLAAATPATGPTSAPSATPSSIPSGTPSPSATPAKPFKATYTGNRFGANANAVLPHGPPCGYSPAVVQQAYGVTDILKAGFDGTGQTIVIIDAFGSPTIQADAQAFSAASNLPAPNLQVYSPSGPPVVGAWNEEQQGWAGETTLDVEWAHVVAPGAKIALVQAASSSDDDLAAAMAYALDNHLGDIISNSWGGPESEEDDATIALWNILLKTAASQGVAVNFSSGDSGDYISTLGYLDVSYPASSAWVTGVGGTALALNADGSIKFQAGWGNSGVRIADGVDTADQSVALQNSPLNPPAKLGFVGGAGGGTSRLVAKPAFQSALPGARRLVPDIAHLADPYTGVELIESAFDPSGVPQPGTLTIEVIGGTSLAAPMFSGLWALANQAHGSSLGQAAPLLYQLPAEAITDIVPVGSSSNVTGVINDGTSAKPLNALSLALPQTLAPYYSAFYNSPHAPFRWNILSFGTDSTLQTTEGWDNVTGLGVPNGLKFIQALKSH